MANEITKNSSGIAKPEEWQNRLMAAIPSHVDRQRFLAVALAVMAGPDMRGCTSTSVMRCIYSCAKLGLVPDPHMGHIYIIPRNDKNEPSGKKVANVQIGFRGYIELARRSGRIGAVECDIVFRGEEWSYHKNEKGSHIHHVPHLDSDLRADLNQAIAVYCVADMIGSWPQVKVMAYKEALAAKRFATTEKVWNEHEAEMVLKTCVRRASKLWPMSAELAKATAWDEQQERGERQSLDDPSPSNAPQLADSPRQIESLDDDEPQDDQNEGTE